MRFYKVSDGLDNTVYFPMYNYKSSDELTFGYNANDYEKVDVFDYYDKIILVLNSLTIGELGVRLYFMNSDGELSNSYIFVWKPFEDRCDLRFYISDDPLDTNPPFLGFFQIPITKTIAYHGATYNDGIRIYSDENNKYVNDTMYTVRTTGDNFIGYNTVPLVDEINNYFMIKSFGSLQPARPSLYTVRVKSRGSRIFNLRLFEGDPMDDGGISDVAYPDGTFNGNSDAFEDSTVPFISVVDTGFVTLYKPSLGQLKSLANYMWSSDLVNQFKKIFADPMDAILGLSVVPVPIEDGGTLPVKIGNVATDVNMTLAGNELVTVDCGSLLIEKYWGNYLDFSPYTKMYIYLPFIGSRPLDPDEVMGKVLSVRYKVDILTGSCVCRLMSQTTDGQSYIIGEYEGNCARQIPVTGSTWTQILTSAVQTVGNIASFGVMAGAGNIGAGVIVDGLTSTAGNVMGAKPFIQRSGNTTGAGGHLSYAKPFVIMVYPNQSLPNAYKSFEGYPANLTYKLGDITGYTVVESIHLEGVNATDTELSGIESLLRNGVIL